jgi:hypothetical protein
VCVCVLITAGPSTKLFTWGGGGGGVDDRSFIVLTEGKGCLLLQDLVQRCWGGVSGCRGVPIPHPEFGLYKDIKTFVCVRFF